jgi:hypothetical protein
MGMQVLESQYQAKTDEKHLRLVVELEQLTPEAQVQLHTGLAKRGISEARREDFRAEKNQTRTETTERSKITLLFPSLRRLAENVRDWKRYKGQTVNGRLFPLSPMRFTGSCCLVLRRSSFGLVFSTIGPRRDF